ncbi:MAG: prepilin-type N-terminal cleavage/methylation domain-containing protein [Candidatus Pacebacteria bacterium]|nr:prepilin-type N-terminal cleavage/methylation domain-containing protein [Candidatus Paceibacterota bacterium]
MQKLIKQAFTLIELLVVIAIIGILSGLIVVTMNGVTQKANMAKAQVFSNSLRNAIMLNLVSEWKFDQVSSNQASDSWGSNTGTLYDTDGACDSTHCPQLQTTGCVYNNCLYFDGTDYINFGDVLDIGTSDLTISVWVKPSLPFSGTKCVIGKANDGSDDGRYSICISSGSKIRSVFDPGNGLTVDSINNLVSEWNLLTATWDRDGDMKIYLNGNFENNISISVGNGQNYNTTIPFLIGTYQIGRYYFVGSIDDARIFFSALPTSQINEQYYAGMNSLLINNNISAKEYVRLLANK